MLKTYRSLLQVGWKLKKFLKAKTFLIILSILIFIIKFHSYSIESIGSKPKAFAKGESKVIHFQDKLGVSSLACGASSSWSLNEDFGFKIEPVISSSKNLFALLPPRLVSQQRGDNFPQKRTGESIGSGFIDLTPPELKKSEEWKKKVDIDFAFENSVNIDSTFISGTEENSTQEEETIISNNFSIRAVGEIDNIALKGILKTQQTSDKSRKKGDIISFTLNFEDKNSVLDLYDIVSNFSEYTIYNQSILGSQYTRRFGGYNLYFIGGEIPKELKISEYNRSIFGTRIEKLIADGEMGVNFIRSADKGTLKDSVKIENKIASFNFNKGFNAIYFDPKNFSFKKRGKGIKFRNFNFSGEYALSSTVEDFSNSTKGDAIVLSTDFKIENSRVKIKYTETDEDFFSQTSYVLSGLREYYINFKHYFPTYSLTDKKKGNENDEGLLPFLKIKLWDRFLKKGK